MNPARELPLPRGAVPVQPDADEARRLLEDELAKGIYQEAQPSLLERAWTAFLNWLGELLGQIRSVDAGLGTVLLAVGAVVVIAVAILLIKPRLNARKRPEPAVFQQASRLSAQAHRTLSEAAAKNRDWDEALTERFRAITRAAEERIIIDEQAGRTAAEVAAQLQNLFNVQSADLDWLALRFNEVHYGARPATEADCQRAAELDQDLLHAQPRRHASDQQWAAPV
jgi:ribosomal protein S20